MDHDTRHAPSTDTERQTTGVPGLDTILRGGLFRGAIYLIQGVPGAGKTILANQLCFRAIAGGGRVLYLTLLSESHGRLIQQLRGMGFFDPAAIPARIHYVSGFRQLQTEGLGGVLAMINREITGRQIAYFVIDGLRVASEMTASVPEMKRFVHDLQAMATMHGCTGMLLTSGAAADVRAEDTMVDGLFHLDADLFGSRPTRRITVRKFRGDGPLQGSHPFRIDDSGVSVFPRIESMFTDPPSSRSWNTVISSGVPTLDALVARGGLPDSSTTVVAGPPGSGKTTLALHFLDRCDDETPGIGVSFFEPPTALLHKAEQFSLTLADRVERGGLSLIWHAPGSAGADELAHGWLEQVSLRRARRLAIDGMGTLLAALGEPQRDTFIACLCNELRRRGVTTLLTLDPAGTASAVPDAERAAIAAVDNLVRLGVDPERHRGTITLEKMRDSNFDRGVREFTISRAGCVVGAPVAPTTLRESRVAAHDPAGRG